MSRPDQEAAKKYAEVCQEWTSGHQVMLGNLARAYLALSRRVEEQDRALSAPPPAVAPQDTPPVDLVSIPDFPAVYRFMRSNPLSSFEALAEIMGLGNEDKAQMSAGRLRELWKLGGGAVDKKNRAWIEIDLLPAALRKVIDTSNALLPTAPEKSNG